MVFDSFTSDSTTSIASGNDGLNSLTSYSNRASTSMGETHCTRSCFLLFAPRGRCVCPPFYQQLNLLRPKVLTPASSTVSPNIRVEEEKFTARAEGAEPSTLSMEITTPTVMEQTPSHLMARPSSRSALGVDPATSTVIRTSQTMSGSRIGNVFHHWVQKARING